MTIQMQAAAYGAPDSLRPIEVETPSPGQGEVTVEIRAVGVNPTDFKEIAGSYGQDPAKLPIRPGHEISGVITALGPGTEISSGPAAVGDEVLAYLPAGGYAAALTVPADAVFAKPATLDFAQAANLLLVGGTAADLLRAARVATGETILVHGASGAVGVSLLQQAARLGVRVIGTASEQNFEVVAGFGAEPVAYGDGLERRVRNLAPDGVDAALDCVGTDEAVDVSLALVSKKRIITIAAFGRLADTGIIAVGGADLESEAFRASARPRLVEMAAAGDLSVPMGRTYPLAAAAEALSFLQAGHPGGKLALIP